jgi:hypothetical protein
MVRFLITQDSEWLKQRPRRSCLSNDEQGDVLYPGKTTDIATNYFLYAPTNQGKVTNAEGLTQGWVVGCITYNDQFGYLYHALFTYRYVDPSSHRAVQFPLKPNTSIPGRFELYSSSIDTPDYDKDPQKH